MANRKFKRFLRIYAELLVWLIALTVSFGCIAAPIVLFLVKDNPLWLLLYILIIPLIVAVIEYAEEY